MALGSFAVALARARFGTRLKDSEVLLWGAGTAAEVTARYLMKAGIGQLWVVNRTQKKAEDLTALCKGGWLSWEQALARLAHVDLAIVCTQAPHYVIDEADMATVLPQRRSRPLLIVDLAVPRNVDPAVAQLPGVFLHNIDHLQAVAQAARIQRTQELSRCTMLVEQQVGHFMRWWQQSRHKDQEVSPCRFAEAPSLV